MSTEKMAREELSYEERATWGVCPTCHATPGEWCVDVQQSPQRQGVHLGRLQQAPRYKETRYV